MNGLWILFVLLAWFILGLSLALFLGSVMGSHKIRIEKTSASSSDQTPAEHSDNDHDCAQSRQLEFEFSGA
jgi:hypothetical protein